MMTTMVEKARKMVTAIDFLKAGVKE